MYINGKPEGKKGYRQDIEYVPPTYLNHEILNQTGGVYNAMVFPMVNK